MSNLYVRSTDGNNADNGSTWALAKATLAGAAAIDAAGDVIYLSQSHAESSAAVQTISLAGTKAAPSKVIAGNDAAEPPTAVATARVITTGGNSISISPAANGAGYVYGISFEAGSGAVTATINLNGSAAARMVYESCDFLSVATSSNVIITNGATQSLTEWRNCRIKFGGNASSIQTSTNGFFRWCGGSVISGGSTPTTTNSIFTGSGGGSCSAFIEDVDFSNFTSGVHICSGAGFSSFLIRDCKLPSGWSGNLCRLTPTIDSRHSLYNCSAGTQNYKLWIETVQGSIRDETTLIRSGGASDGTTPISWKLVSTANCAFPSSVLYTDLIVFWCGSTGSALTAEIQILHDSATNLKDNEVWLELVSLNSSATPLGTFAQDRAADPVASAADQTTSSVSWTTTGMANPNKQVLSVAFTPNMKGFVLLRVAVAKPSYTLYVCPKVEVAGLVNKAQYQMPGSPWHHRFSSGAFINIMNNTKQEQVPGCGYIIESTSSSSLIQDLSNYFMAC